jgi:hypothetical protein
VNKDKWLARGFAWEEAAGHLEMKWTDIKEEENQGKVVTDFCIKMAEKCFRKAHESRV